MKPRLRADWVVSIEVEVEVEELWSTIITKHCVLRSTDITLQNREYLQYSLSNGKHR